jgi:SPP1 family predicted phage head-tail adaptor
MASGRLDSKAVLQRRSGAVDAVGQPVEAWVDIATVWADIRHQSGLEALRGDAPVSSVATSIRIRHLDGLDAGIRVVADGVTYAVEAVLPHGRRELTDLVCKRLGG